MTNLLNNPIYVSVANAKASSTILSWLTDNEIAVLITKAQIAIDWYLWSYWLPEDVDQDFIFPTTDWIPTDIQIATVMVSEFIYLSGESLASMQGSKVKAESNMSRSVTFENVKTNSNDLTSQIPVSALSILKKYKNSFIWQVI